MLYLCRMNETYSYLELYIIGTELQKVLYFLDNNQCIEYNCFEKAITHLSVEIDLKTADHIVAVEIVA